MSSSARLTKHSSAGLPGRLSSYRRIASRRKLFRVFESFPIGHPLLPHDDRYRVSLLPARETRERTVFETDRRGRPGVPVEGAQARNPLPTLVHGGLP